MLSIKLTYKHNIVKSKNMKKTNDREKLRTETIAFKTTPRIKQVLEDLAEEGFRPLSSQVAMIIIKYLEEQGIDWRETPEKKAKK
jgi:hypothetical protein